MVSWSTPLVQFEYDTSDGEVRAAIEVPLDDSTLSKAQLVRCLRTLAGVVDDHHATIFAAMTRGEIPKPPTDAEMAALWAEFQEFLAQKRRATAAGGGHGLPE
jgi:hypothetical protein